MIDIPCSFAQRDKVIPGSDGAGTVVAVGDDVTRFKPGDKVLTLFNQGHIGGSLTAQTTETGLGGVIDGTLRQYGAFDQEGLVKMPEGLDFVEASTLCCAGLTAWDALYGLRTVKAGEWVLTQGTGGVSLFGIQFAKAAGARVVATTGSNEKVDLLKKLGADHVINYKETPDWGKKAKELTGGGGCNHIIEVAGPKSMQQSLDAVAIDGIISIIGFVGGMGGEKEPGFLECLLKICTVRGLLVGSRVLLEDMCRAVEANVEKLRPVVDSKVFTLETVKDAYQYQWDAKHIGKVCIKID